MMFSSSINFLTDSIISPLFSDKQCSVVSICHIFVIPVTSWLTSRLLLCPCCCEQNSDNVHILQTLSHESFGCVPSSGVAGSQGSSIFSFWRCRDTQQSASPPTEKKGSLLSTVSLALVATCLLDSSYSDWYEMKSQRNLNLHFPVGKNVEQILKCLLNIHSSSFENSVHFHGYSFCSCLIS